VKDTVGKLESDGSVESIEHYWIVTGFDCRATGKGVVIALCDTG